MGKTGHTPCPTPSRGTSIGALRGKTAAPKWEGPAPLALPEGPVPEEKLIEIASSLASSEQQITETSEAMQVLKEQDRLDDLYELPTNDVYSEIFRFRQWITLVRAYSGKQETIRMRDVTEAEKAMTNWRTPAATRRLRNRS